MKQALDATFLSQLYYPDSPPPCDLNGNEVEFAKERVTFLITRWNKENTQLIVPTPALCELFTILDFEAISEVLDKLSTSGRFKVANFDARAAIEAALWTKAAISEGQGKKDSLQKTTWSKIKFDRQIVAIAKAEGADTLYSDDPDMRVHGKRAGIKIVRTEDLPIPPEAIPPPLFRNLTQEPKS